MDDGHHDRNGAFAALAARVHADDAVQARLGASDDPHVFAAEVSALAAAHGIAFTLADVAARLRPDPIGIDAFRPSPVTLDRWPGRGWLPVRAAHGGAEPAFDWAWFGADPLAEPFYEESIRRAAARPLSRMFRPRTTLAAIVRDAPAGRAPAGPTPAGFVHHLSRCGSTLVARMIAAIPDTIVLSEPEPFDAVLRWALESGAPLDEQVAALRGIAAALGRDRSGGAARTVFKLDSWHVVALPLLRAAFPDTPWTFLYRDPIEVLVSQQRRRGIHTVAGMLPPALVDIPGAAGMAADDYAARVLALMEAAVLTHWSVGGGMLVDYAELPSAAIGRIAPHFGLAPDAAARAAMGCVAETNAKQPDQPFTPDSALKHRDASTAIARAARDVVGPVHARLAALRHTDEVRPG